MRMKQYYDTIQPRQDAMKSIYSYIVATMSKSSWQRMETFFKEWRSEAKKGCTKLRFLQMDIQRKE